MGGPWVQKRLVGSSGHCVGYGLTWGHGHGAPQAGEGHDQQPQHLQVVLRGSWTPSTNFGKGGRKLRLVWTGGWPPPSCFHVSAPGAPRTPFIPLTQEMGTGLCAAARSILYPWGPGAGAGSTQPPPAEGGGGGPGRGRSESPEPPARMGPIGRDTQWAGRRETTEGHWPAAALGGLLNRRRGGEARALLFWVPATPRDQGLLPSLEPSAWADDPPDFSPRP